MNRTILVGNGPSLLNKDYGEFIDAHTVVVRFNHFKTAGFERHTGRKIDIWAVNDYWLGGQAGGGIYWKHDFPRPHTVVFMHWTQSNGEPLYEVRARQPIPNCTTLLPPWLARKMDELRDGRPIYFSIGFMAAVLYQPCDLVGFDHFQGPVHHYHDQDKLPPGIHAGPLEREIIEDLIQQGQAERH